MLPPINRSQYFLLPRTSSRRMLALGRLLGHYQPQDPSVDVEETGQQLAEIVDTVADAFVERYREYGPSIAADEVEFDAVTDILFYIMRDRVLHWELFTRPGVAQLASEQAGGSFDFAPCIDKAAVAARVRGLLLDQGLDFLRLPYLEQSEHMLTLWTIIEQEQLEAPLIELIGADFFHALAECRTRYVEMVERRTARITSSSVNLRTLGLQLQRAIQNYVIALLAMIRDDDDDNVQMIRKALRPIDALREQLDRERSRVRLANDDATEPDAALDDAATEPDAALDNATLDALIAEQQAIDTQFGLTPDTP